MALLVTLASAASAEPIPPIHNLAMIEFVESPPTGLVISGGLLGVPDSSGVFPTPYRRFDPTTGNHADPGRVDGDALVFANLRPGTYRLAMVFLTESRLASRVLPKHRERLEDHCLVYADSLPALTFTIGDGECRYLGRVVRRSLPSLAGDDGLWKTTLEWSAGDERKVLKSLEKRKDMKSWRELLEAHRVALDREPTTR
jgi:hypothetical protein